MARRHNNWGGSSYGVLGGSNVKSSSPDGAWNRRGPFINLIEGSPAPYSDNRYLLPEYFLDTDDGPALDVPAPLWQNQIAVAFADSEELPSAPPASVVTEDDNGLSAAPGAERFGVLSFGDIEELKPVLQDDEAPPARISIASTVSIAFGEAEEPSFVIEDADGFAPSAPRLVLVPSPVGDAEELTPILEEADGTSVVPAQLALVSVPASDTEELAPILEEADGAAPSSPQLSLVPAPTGDTEELTPILEEADGVAPSSPQLSLVPAPTGDTEELTPILEDADGISSPPPRLYLVPAPTGDTEELSVVFREEESTAAAIVAPLMPGAFPGVGDTEELPSGTPPPPPTVEAGQKKWRRQVGGTWLYYDDDQDEVDWEEEIDWSLLDTLIGAIDTIDSLEDVRVEVRQLETAVVVESVQASATPIQVEAGVRKLGNLEVRVETPSPSISVDPLDVFVTVDVEDDE